MSDANGRVIGLSLSGGSFRATLFGLGTLWRLNDLGWLPRLDKVVSVSGGSITAGLLACRWKDLRFRDGRGENFEELVARPLQRFAGEGISYWVVIRGLLDPFKGAAHYLGRRYEEGLYGPTLLSALPEHGSGDAPEFILYATSLQTGRSVRMTREHLHDELLGVLPYPDLTLAEAVAASSAFPPLLSPALVRTYPDRWRPDGGSTALHALRRRLVLTDGGTYDNTGLDTLLDRCDTVLASDAGSHFRERARPSSFWLSQLIRVNSLSQQHFQSWRRSSFVSQLELHRLEGAYWGVATRIDDYGLESAMTRDSAATAELAAVPDSPRLRSDRVRGRLVNWGYALADAAIRRYVWPEAPVGAWPIPAHAL